MASKTYFAIFSSILIILLFVQTHATPFDFIKSLEGSRKGDSVEGLNELKKYLQQFGYLKKGDTDDDFNQDLESAIKTYQLNYNLEITGTLDAETTSQMMQPRCGVADIIDGETSRMNSNKNHQYHNRKLLAHFVSHYSFYNGNKWPSGPSPSITYGFPNNANNAPFTNAITSALNKWRIATGRFTFTRINTASTANLKVGLYAGNHGDGVPFDGQYGVLGHTFPPTDGRCHFDSAENYSFGPTASSSQIHFETLALHELGHDLGLGHSSVNAAIMYSGLGNGQVKNLQPDDIAGIHDLYG